MGLKALTQMVCFGAASYFAIETFHAADVYTQRQENYLKAQKTTTEPITLGKDMPDPKIPLGYGIINGTLGLLCASEGLRIQNSSNLEKKTE